MADLNWRPAAASMHNLVWFWLATAVSASAVVAARGDGADRSTLVALLVAAVAGGLLVAAMWSRPRFFRALDAAARPHIRAWPPTSAERVASASAAAGDARRATAIAVVIGAGAGFVPLVGSAVAAAGAAGFVGTLLVLRSVRRYESTHHETVLTLADAADAPKGSRNRQLVVGVVPDVSSGHDAQRVKRR